MAYLWVLHYQWFTHIVLRLQPPPPPPPPWTSCQKPPLKPRVQNPLPWPSSVTETLLNQRLRAGSWHFAWRISWLLQFQLHVRRLECGVRSRQTEKHIKTQRSWSERQVGHIPVWQQRGCKSSPGISLEGKERLSSVGSVTFVHKGKEFPWENVRASPDETPWNKTHKSPAVVNAPGGADRFSRGTQLSS